MDPRHTDIPPHKLLSTLRGYDLLPAIVFMPTRRKCDEAALGVANDRKQPINTEKQRLRRQIYEAFVKDNPEVKTHKHVKILLNSGVASHHAGHMPPWKLLIEKMMSAGLLDALFATSTVAAGVDFPARTAVISNADTRGDDGWRTLKASELQQMTGRAGRRGRDKVGFVILAPGQFQNPQKIAELLKMPPDPLESQFRATYSSLLNLLDAYKSFEQVREIAQKSFAFRNTSRQIDKIRRERENLIASLDQELWNNDFVLTTDNARGYCVLQRVRRRLSDDLPFSRVELRLRWLGENVTTGRIISLGRGEKHLYIVIGVNGDKFTAMREDGQGASFALSRVTRIYVNKYSINNRNIEQAFFDVLEGKNPPLAEPRLSLEKHERSGPIDILDKLLGDFSSHIDNGERGSFEILLKKAANDIALIDDKEREIDFLFHEIWSPFERRAKILDHFGYLDLATQTVTENGKWLADVRVDRTLLVGEALRRGIFNGLTPGAAAGLMASLVADSDRNYGELYLSDELLEIINSFESVIHNVATIEHKFGIESAEELNLSAAAAAEWWATGSEWNDLVRRTNAEEGDLFRLFARTAEALMQIAYLKTSNPAAATLARISAEMLLREPVR